MKLPKAAEALVILVDYIVAAKGASTSTFAARVRHDVKCDAYNREKARAFCFTRAGSWTIHCSKNIERVSDEVLIGLLLHEMGHIAIQAFHSDKNDTCEVDVDRWVAKNFPEAGYHYKNHSYRTARGKDLTAKSIEHVSKRFAKTILGA